MSISGIKKVACIGAGTIGSSWATNSCMKGYPVVLYDISEPMLEKAKKNIKDNLDFLSECGVFNKEEVQAALDRVTLTTDMKALGDVQFIQENGPENYEIKQGILAQVDKVAPRDAIYASSTSGLLISEISKYSEYADRCVGAHPYNPPHLIPLVELAKGEKTKDEVLETACELYKAIGKEPVILKKEILGFIANRLQAALYREVIEIVNRGVCTVEDVDKACLFGPGLRYGILGPNLIWHLGGGEGGLKHLLDFIRPTIGLWYNDMSDAKDLPDGWSDKAMAGVLEEMKNRDKEFGNTSAEVARFRDQTLVELLRIHKKL
ncbi:3-hydroxyacyl-CoA dehydrogenase family protein [Papillibacter cinnamivorans]|uniref:3-hydroxyacyl-CoA dehydrogenase n=1 Tax=Papillibacter cinnamivorans DSM 12816 TaxID=1122930 RepID=A0A1W2CBQ8_9FIRM|nr:3-hydroxyacyl-CoA dehydrogenase family protein [Papillibacter cinnamivorans]SMC82599.1 3-hydroxyacyl-CoA dehydrogenase [Papillibacter cinnamivorans DSM 12816]